MSGRFLVMILALSLSGCAFLQKVVDSLPDPPSPPPVVEPPVKPPEKPVEPPPVVVEPPVLHFYCPSSGGEYELLSRIPSPYSKVINEVMEEVSGCAPSSDCAIGKTPEESTVFRGRVIAGLAKRRICAWLQEDTTDAPIAVGTEEENFTHHIVNFGGFKIRWQPSANEPPDRWELVKPLEPVKVCSELIEIGIKTPTYAQRSIDATPWTGPREVCDALGFSNRGSCPFGVEIEGQHNPEKIRCEAFYGPYTCTVNGDECSKFNENPLQWNASSNGVYKICSRTGICKEVVLQ